jgi:hypothetical protein
MEAIVRRLALRDEAIPVLPDLLGDGHLAMLEAAFSASDARVLQARLANVTWRPGQNLTVQYDVRLSSADGCERRETIVARTGGALPEGAVILDGDAGRVALWRMAADPALPGLGAVLDPGRGGALLVDLGAPPGDVSITIKAYRPGRRAVVELLVPGARLFAKVVSPGEAQALHARHRLLAQTLPVPQSHGWSEDLGIVALQPLPGVTLREALANGLPAPAPGEVLGVLEAIPAPADGRRSPALVDAAVAHAGLLRRLLPEESGRLDTIIDAVQRAAGASPLVPVHGDYYETQVTVLDGRLAGMLDIDTMGLGHRVDDHANAIAHLAVWGPSSPRPGEVNAYANAMLAVATAADDPATLRMHVAAAIVGLATGPFRVQSPRWPEETRARLALATRWVESARRASRAKTVLTHAS